MKQIICTICKRKKAMFFRPYSGEKLCRKCFITSIENKVRITIAKYNMLEYDDTVAVAVSGGRNSTSLLYILTKIERSYPKSSLCAISIDEGIKGYRDKALKIASKLCGKLGIQHHIVSFRELYGCTQDEIIAHARKEHETRLTPCTYCGVLRRKALNIAARNIGVHKIATAHSLDSEIQTAFLHILHGNPLGISTEKSLTNYEHGSLVQRIKPFCEILEKEMTLYAYLRRIEIQEMLCPYTSDMIRNDVRLFLDEMEINHVGTKFITFSSIERIKPMIQKMVKKEELMKCKECGEPTIEKICPACQMLYQLRII